MTEVRSGLSLLAQIVGAPRPDRSVEPPDPDTDGHLRLVYADWLEEHDEPRRCGRCGGGGMQDRKQDRCGVCGCLWRCQGGAMYEKNCMLEHPNCPDCGRKGWVPGERAARAEFIRVQIALAGAGLCPATIYRPEFDTPTGHNKRYILHPPVREKKSCGWCPVCVLRRREKALLESLQWGTSTGEPSENVRSAGRYVWAGPAARVHNPDGRGWKFDRGFVTRLRCTGQEWWGEAGRPNHGPDIVRAAPLEEDGVWITDAAPHCNRDRWYWYGDRGGMRSAPHYLPEPVFRCMIEAGLWFDYERGESPLESERQAMEWLSRGCLAWARLPPCGECGGEGRTRAGWHPPLRRGDPPRMPYSSCRLCHGLGRALQKGGGA